MYLTMNRFPVQPGTEEAFETTWKDGNTWLHTVAGLVSFDLLQGPVTDDVRLYSSHMVWRGEEDFRNWLKSEAFRAAHSNPGKYQGIIIGMPKLECFASVHSVSL